MFTHRCCVRAYLPSLRARAPASAVKAGTYRLKSSTAPNPQHNNNIPKESSAITQLEEICSRNTHRHKHTFRAMATPVITPAARKRKRASTNTVASPQPINRQQLLAQAKSRFPTLLKFLPHPRTMLFVRQTWDDSGSEWKLLIGHLYCESAKLPLYAHIKEPFWVTYTFGVGHKLSAINLDLDNSVMLLQPFCAIGTAPQTAGLEAVILFYFVVCHRWDEYDVGLESFINVDVLHMACRTVRDGTALQRRRDMIEMQEAFPDTLEDSLSSGEDSDEDSVFVKTCKRCRRIEREDSRCRTEGHIEK